MWNLKVPVVQPSRCKFSDDSLSHVLKITRRFLWLDIEISSKLAQFLEHAQISVVIYSDSGKTVYRFEQIFNHALHSEVYLCTVQSLKSTKTPLRLPNTNVKKTNTLKWLLLVYALRVRTCRPVCRGKCMFLLYNYNIVNIIMEYIPIKQY